MSENRDFAVNFFIERYLELFNKNPGYIKELYRNNSKCRLVDKDCNFEEVHGSDNIVKLKSIGKEMMLKIEEIYNVQTSHYPKAISFSFKGHISIDDDEKIIEQNLHIARHDYDEIIYIIEEKIVILEKID